MARPFELHSAMRVLHLGAGNIYGGIERALVAYAAGQATCAEMVPHFALCFAGQLATELQGEGAGVTVLGPAKLSRPFTVVRARRELASLLSEYRPDIVVTHGPWVHCLLGPVVQRAGLPLALFFHNPPALHWLDLLARRTRPQIVIANSSFTLRETAWWTRETPAVVCTPPFKTQTGLSRVEARAKLALDPNTVLVLQASRLDPYKGHRLHLRALAKLEVEVDWRAAFAGGSQPGKDGYVRSLVKLRNRLGLRSRVDFLGHRTDVADLLAAADLFCHPNVAPEPFGIAFVEAMLAGVPVVATKMGGAEEILGQGGGELVLPKVSEVAASLRRLILDCSAREKLGREGREIAQRMYTLETGTCALALALSEALLQRPRAAASRAWV
jgi:glycosyltransferase involved in cell wall biosynthesis